MKNSTLNLIIFTFLFLIKTIEPRWSIEKAKKWYSEQAWLVGCNFIPSNAGNQLEMWQEETFDPQILNKELQYAQNIGFNIVRVFLHYLVWQQNADKFKQRINTYLDIAYLHNIRTMFVFFDDCWNPNPELGPQGEPIPGVHNSMWLQCPGLANNSDPTLYPVLKNYVQDIMTTFANDARVVIFDLYNEPGQQEHENDTLPLLTEVYKWASEIKCIQPLTIGVWGYREPYLKFVSFAFDNSDIISYHSYGNLSLFTNTSLDLQSRANGRPLICTEYLARGRECKFQTHLPFMKSKNIGALNWGLVNGRTQTIFPWKSPENASTPEIWFHEIFDKDGKAFDIEETDLIKKLSTKQVK